MKTTKRTYIERDALSLHHAHRGAFVDVVRFQIFQTFVKPLDLDRARKGSRTGHSLEAFRRHSGRGGLVQNLLVEPCLGCIGPSKCSMSVLVSYRLIGAKRGTGHGASTYSGTGPKPLGRFIHKLEFCFGPRSKFPTMPILLPEDCSVVSGLRGPCSPRPCSLESGRLVSCFE